MAKKSVEGQIDLFELFGSVEELEEKVKGVPEVPEGAIEPQAEQDIQPHTANKTEQVDEKKAVTVEMIKSSACQVVMQKTFRNRTTGKTAVIAYLDYNKVYQKIWENEPLIYQFEQSKDAVDYYVSQMERFSEDKQIEIAEEQEPIIEASLTPWPKE